MSAAPPLAPFDRRALLAALAVAAVTPAALGRTPINELTIVTAAGARHRFTLEIANTPETRSRGLMFRRELAPDHGMLFDFGGAEQPIQMWMKNTYIPLDMIFIRANGVIRRIAADTTPFSEDTIASGGPVKGVLEVIAGTARRLGIAAGDRVEHPFFRA